MKKILTILSIAILIGCSKDDDCKYRTEDVIKEYQELFDLGEFHNPNFFNTPQYEILLIDRSKKLEQSC